MKLYNTLSKKKENFKPIKGKNVGMYTCGPTVYWYQHIGNLRSYIFADILRRVLLYNKFKVKQVMNVTDVGHLTSDANVGEDKIEKAAKKEHKKASEIANFYWKIFRQDFKKLNIIEPDIWCKATDHIKEQIGLVKILEKKGYTYKTSDGIYFDTSKLKDYGKLARLKIEGLKAGVRIAMKEKKNPTDFVLWKFSEKPGVRQQEWKSPWGIGFPGWHIECSAMSMKYLGKTFDIHTGGEDHITVHHTNEIAQSEAATGKKFVKFWLHGAFLTTKGEKVSKSKGGLYTISELEEKGFDALTYRYLCLTAHYKTQLEFSIKSLENAQNSFTKLKDKILDFKKSKDKKGSVSKYVKDFSSALDDDLNMPRALAVVWSLVKDSKVGSGLKYKALLNFDKVLGLGLDKVKKVKFSSEVLGLIKKRNKARKDKNWKESDRIRAILVKNGVKVSDSAGGSVYSKV